MEQGFLKKINKTENAENPMKSRWKCNTMKKSFLLISLICIINTGYSQNDSLKRELENTKINVNHLVSTVDSLKKTIKTTVDSINQKFEKVAGKMVRFGVSIGYNTIYKDHMHNYQSASIDLKDTTLKLETMDPYSIKVSTSIIVTPFINADWLQSARARNKAKLTDLRNRKDVLFKQKMDKLTESGATAKQRRKEARKTMPRLPRSKFIFGNIANGAMYIIQNIGLTANINILEFNKAQSNLAFNKSMEGGVGGCLRLHENIFISFSNELYFSRQLRQNIKNYENQKLYVDNKIVTSFNDLDITDDDLFITRNIIARSFKVIIIF